MQKKFLSNLILIVLLNLLVKPFFILGIDAEVQNRVGEVAYGNYFALLNFSFLLNILLDFGLTNYNVRNIAQHPKQIHNHFEKILSLRIALFFVYVAVTLLVGALIDYSAQEYYFLIILMINQFFVAVIQFSRSNFAGLHLFKTDAFISILDRSILIGICAALLWTNWFGGTMKIEWFIYAQTVAYGLSALVSIGLIKLKITHLRFKIKRVFSIYILKQSLPYALLILLMMMYSRIDAVMLERLLPNGDQQAGIYAQGFRLLDAVNMFALLFAGLLLPIFAKQIKEKVGIEPITGLSFRILFGISTIVGLTCFFYQYELIQLRYPNSSAISPSTFGYLILSFIPVSITYVFGTLLTANGSLKYLNQMALGGVLLNVILNFILIQTHQAIGAAIATLVTQVITAAVQMMVAYRIFKFNFGFSYYARLLGLVIVLLTTYYLIEEYAQFNRLNTILPYFIFGCTVAMIFGIFKISDFKAILKKEN